MSENPIVQFINDLIPQDAPDSAAQIKELFAASIQELMPDMLLCEYSEVNDTTSKQSYKFLYGQLLKENENYRSEISQLYLMVDANELQIKRLTDKVSKLSDTSEEFGGSVTELLNAIKASLKQQIYISDVRVFDSNDKEIVQSGGLQSKIKEDDLSLRPAIYDFKRPAWYTPLRTELNAENLGRKIANDTKKEFSEKIRFWKLFKRDKAVADMTLSEKANTIEMERRRRVVRILNSNISNDEKYIKYFMITPGMSREYMRTLDGAASLGLDANLVIEFLEQPEGMFNRETLETYISQVQKGAANNLKKELACELIRGEWYVTTEDSDGAVKKWQMVPQDELMDISKKLDLIFDIVSDIKKAQTNPRPDILSANLAESDEAIFDRETETADEPQLDVSSESDDDDIPEEEFDDSTILET